MRILARAIAIALQTAALAAPAMVSAARSAQQSDVPREFLLGRWTDNGDCAVTIELLRDGTFVAPTGEGLWQFDGDRLSFIGSRTVRARVQAADEDTILLIHDDWTLGRSRRCPSAIAAEPAVTATATPELVSGAA